MIQFGILTGDRRVHENGSIYFLRAPRTVNVPEDVQARADTVNGGEQLAACIVAVGSRRLVKDAERRRVGDQDVCTLGNSRIYSVAIGGTSPERAAVEICDW